MDEQELLRLRALRDLDAVWSYVPLPEQLPFFTSTAKYRLVRGGNRSSKTVCCAIEVARWLRGIRVDPSWRPIARPRKGKVNILAATIDYSHIGDVLWRKLSAPGAYSKWRFNCPKCDNLIFDVPVREERILLPDDPKGRFNGFTGIVHCLHCDYKSDIDELPAANQWQCPPLIPESCITKLVWGDKGKGIPDRVETEHAILRFKSGNSGRKHFQGGDDDLAWIDEELGSESAGVFEEINRGTIDRKGIIIWSATPLAKQDTMLDLHDRARTGDADVLEITLGLANNHHLSTKERESVIKGWPRDQWRCRVNGEFLIMEGLVYGEFDSDIHVIKAFDIDAPEYLKSFTWYKALDPGIGTTGCLWFAVDCYNNYIIADELYLHQAGVQDIVREMRKVDKERHIVDTVIDPSDQRSVFCREGLRVVLRRDYGIPTHSNFTRDVQQGIFRVKEDLALDPTTRKPKIQIFDSCTMLIKELSRYRRKDNTGMTDQSNKIIKKFDHLCFVAGTMVSTAEGERPIEDIRRGDQVVTRQGLKTVTCAMKTGERETCCVTFSNGESICGTLDHPVYLYGGKTKELSKLEFSDRVITLPMGYKEYTEDTVITTLQVTTEGIAPVYNITVADAHEYYANGILVSNCDCLRYRVMAGLYYRPGVANEVKPSAAYLRYKNMERKALLKSQSDAANQAL